ncbi:hypothetical protein [uncultured Catenibacterium sp.]|uniref:hypothetical protein n=1 Tax=uncultured Catenibacterium sp. TaxID=286142 RepID=UPI0025E75FC3|nr:hypothetical protein [uncultured Catenibacterium sp.]
MKLFLYINAKKIEIVIFYFDNYLWKVGIQNNGYFGDKGTSSQVRVIYGNDPVNIGKDFYKKISFGGIEKDLDNGKGKITYMADGSIITFRPITKSDNYPAVNINISRSTDSGGIKTQKIHFGKEDEKK